VLLPAVLTGLPKDSVANVSQIVSVDKSLLRKPTGKLSPAKIRLLLSGIDIILGR
jgi:mRNA interferase MazF